MLFTRDTVRFLTFGFVVALFSGVGQTFFIGVYKASISLEFDLSNSQFGLYYLLITVGSAVGLNRLGHLIDDIALPRYMLGLMLVLALACFLVAVSGPLVTVFLALFVVRLFGQGMMTHAAMTSMSRYFSAARGRAVAIAGLGLPVGQAILPPMGVLLLLSYDWRTGWALFGMIILLAGVPLVLGLLRGHDVRHLAWTTATAQETVRQASLGPVRIWRRRDVLRDWRFYMMLPGLMAGPFWVTVAFIFAADIAQAKGWTLADYTQLYWLYTAGALFVPLVGGYLVDRFGGVRLLPFYPPCLGLAFLVGAQADAVLGLGFYMALMGLGAGMAVPVNNSMWAELYGTRHLGEIKSLASSLAVLSTALSPFLIGLLLDQGVAINSIMLGCTAHSLLALVLLVPVVRRFRR